MARKHFKLYEAVSSAMPVEDTYEAVIAVKRRDSEDEARFHTVAYGRQYDLLSEAEEAAEAALTKVLEIDEQGGLIFES